MKPEPCSVCGGTDMNLIDGFYYCVECGTQDVNAQETVVEHTVLADGTFAHAASRKFTTILKDAIEMSGEWHKWHTFNFILVGLVDEVTALGASPGFRTKVLWIWTRYMKKFQNKDMIGTMNQLENGEELSKSKLFNFEEDTNEDSLLRDDNDEIIADQKNYKAKQKTLDRATNSIKVVTKGLLLAILHIALNLDHSDIQLSHLCRFIREGRISIVNCLKFVPKELNLKSIPHWKSFANCNREYTPKFIRLIAMSVIKTLDLGTPLVPDLRKMIDNYVSEMCLPVEFKNLVFSLMHQVSYDFLELDQRFVKKALVRLPNFEGTAMAYVLVALKMCFGLDDQYEIDLSDAIDKINNEENRLKSHKLGFYSNSTDRLFSFREWCNYLQFRKTIVCKYYLPVAQQHNLDIDDQVFMEQLEERQQRKKELSDEVTMDILNKIELKDEGSVIPKSEFVPTLTPMSSYTEVILQYFQDPELKLLLSEDFTQYSLKYACEDLRLPMPIKEDNTLKGVSQESKTIATDIIGKLISTQYDSKIVYVRNCENRNWLKTNPPTVEHLTKVAENETLSDRDSDRGYDSNTECGLVIGNVANSTSDRQEDEPERKLEMIEEEAEGISIFDDSFDNIDDDKPPLLNNATIDNLSESKIERELLDSINEDYEDFLTTPAIFNSETFDRDRIIKELVLEACKKYKIPIPKDYNPREPRKRKSSFVEDEVGESSSKKIKKDKTATRNGNKKEIERIMTAYYSHLEKDILHKVSDHVRSFFKDISEVEKAEEQVPVTENLHENHVEDFVHENHEDVIGFDGVENDKILEPSVLEVNNDDGEDLISKVDPNFDEKTHNIKQLYVKYSERFKCEDILNIDDPEIEKILDEKIEDFRQNEIITLSAKDINIKANESDSEDEITLATLKAEKEFMNARKARRKQKFEPLIKESKDITKFKYWLRHYTSATMRKTEDVKLKFDLELQENLPKSFNFVINECAAVLDCSAFSIYKNMQVIERMLIKKTS